jgi:hypothetical protein
VRSPPANGKTKLQRLQRLAYVKYRCSHGGGASDTIRGERKKGGVSKNLLFGYQNCVYSESDI